MNTHNSRRGSAMVIAIVMGLILMAGVAALLGNAFNERRESTHSYMNTSALHLAEAGIEKGTHSYIKKDAWVNDPSGFTDKSFVISNYASGFTVSCNNDPLDATKVIIRSLARVSNPGGGITSERAVEAIFTKVLGGGPSVPDRAFIGQEIQAGLAGQSTHTLDSGTKTVITSASSASSRTPPRYTEVERFGYDGGVLITGTAAGAATIINGAVFGAIDTIGETLRTNTDTSNSLRQYSAGKEYDKTKENTANEDRTLNVNTNGEIYAYPPTDINMDGRDAKTIYTDIANKKLFEDPALVQNRNGRKVVRLGEVGKKTYYEVGLVGMDSKCDLEIVGDVVLMVRKEFYTRDDSRVKIGSIGSDGEIQADMTPDNGTNVIAKLTVVMEDEKFHMDGQNGIQTFDGQSLWLPNQLTICGKYRMVTGTGASATACTENPYKDKHSGVSVSGTNTAEMVVHAGFTGVINAPESTVKLHSCGGDSVTIWGQVICKRGELTNGVHLVYDPNLNNHRSPDGDSLQLVSWRQIKPPADLRAKL